MPTRNQTIHAAILHVVPANSTGAEWSEIMDSVKATGLVVTNWMPVRGVLQSLVNRGKIIRVKGVAEERYAQPEETK